MAPVIVQGTLAIATAILEAAALGFLRTWCTSTDAGVGEDVSGFEKLSSVSPMDNDFPGLAIMLTVLGFNLMGDGLRDALDPKMKS